MTNLNVKIIQTFEGQLFLHFKNCHELYLIQKEES